MIGLIDANNFFVSCERAVNPTLNSKPVVVLSNNDGCVISRSNEVKALGVPMGAPYFQYKDLFAQNNVQIFSVNFPLYQHYSNQIVRVLRDQVELLEVYSIDESFVKIPDQINLEDWVGEMSSKIFNKIGIPVSVGLAPTKTLAKFASHQAKTLSLGGLVINQSDLDQILPNIPIGSVWGIGSRIATRLRRNNIHTAKSFVNYPDDWVRRESGIVGLRIKNELLGLSSFKIGEGETDKKGISSTRSFDKRVFQHAELRSSLIKHLQIATRKLRRQESLTGSLTIFIRTSKHDSGIQYYGKISETLLRPSNDLLELSGLIDRMLGAVYRSGLAYYRSGIHLGNIVKDTGSDQLDLFGAKRPETAVMKTLDQLQAKYSENHLRPACIPKRASWDSKSAYRSFSQSFKECDRLPKLFIGEVVKDRFEAVLSN